MKRYRISQTAGLLGDGLITLFFAANAVMSAAALLGHGPGMRLFVGLALATVFGALLRKEVLAVFPALLGAVAIFFGYQPYSIYGTALNLLLSLTGLTFFTVNRRTALVRSAYASPPETNGGAALSGKRGPGDNLLAFSLAAFAAYCAAGVLLAPWREIVEAAAVFGPSDLYRMAVFSTADSPLYPLAAVNRLALFTLFAFEFSRPPLPDRERNLGFGLAAGLLAATVYGLVQHFTGDVFIYHYRFKSVFANPGWYAEYAVLTAPFLLLPLRNPSRFSRLFAAGGLLLVLAALVLTLSRAAWLAYAPTLCAAALLFFKPNALISGAPARRTPVLLAACALVLVLCLWVSGKQFSHFSRPINALIAERLANFSDSPRPKLFKSGLLIGAEAPLFGLGFESYARHYPVLLNTSGTLLERYGDKDAEVFETPHNTYIQLFAGGGLAGLFLWLLAAGAAARVFLRRVRKRKSLTALAALTALAGFHIYAVFQNMFYVPGVLLVVFLLFGPALAWEREDAAKATAPAGRMQFLKAAAAALVVLCWAAYAANAGMGGTAEKYGLKAYADPGTAIRTEGFFRPEPIAGVRARWSMGLSTLRAPGADAVELELLRPFPDPPGTGAAMYVWRGGRLVDVIDFSNKDRMRRRWNLPGTVPLFLKTVPIHYPNVFGSPDDYRPLGAAVSIKQAKPGEAGAHATDF